LLRSQGLRANGTELSAKLRTSIAERIKRDRRVPRLKEFAAIEGVSVRTQNRSLSASGVKYQEIGDDARRALSSGMIAEFSMPLNEISEAAGFLNASSLSRSFKSWFGESPSQYRARIKRKP